MRRIIADKPKENQRQSAVSASSAFHYRPRPARAARCTNDERAVSKEGFELDEVGDSANGSRFV